MISTTDSQKILIQTLSERAETEDIPFVFFRSLDHSVSLKNSSKKPVFERKDLEIIKSRQLMEQLKRDNESFKLNVIREWSML